MIKYYKKKPVTIQAVQYNGKNMGEITNFITGFNYHINENNELVIHTLEGDIRASVGDYIICGVKGEYYPCKPDVFNQTYEEDANSFLAERIKVDIDEVSSFTDNLDESIEKLSAFIDNKEKFNNIDIASQKYLMEQYSIMTELYLNLKNYIAILNKRYDKLV